MTTSARPMLKPKSMTRAPSALILFVPRQSFWRILFWALLIGMGSAPFSFEYSPWIPAGVALSVFVATHAVAASRVVPWVPGLTLTAACIQWILAPWAVYTLPEDFAYTPMLVPASEYFSFAVPSTLALAAGVFLAIGRLGRRRPRAGAALTPPGFRRMCEAMVIAGLITRILILPLTPGSVRFIASLVAGLALVGVCGLILLRAPGWLSRMVVVVAVEAFYNTLDAQYLDLMLVVGFLTVIMIYRFQPRPRVIVAAVAVATLALVTLNAMKMAYRGVIQTEQVIREERPGEAGATLYQLLADPSRIFAAENLAYNLNRLNQGAIISRVMVWVPQSEPFARGETILTSARSALVPRVLDPSKPLAGGFANYVRFTGFQLYGGTSINIAIVGEMFANFGAGGGVIAVLFYGLALGLLFRLFIYWSWRSPLWWAWIPFIFYATVSAEMGTNEVLNQVTKALVVMYAISFSVPVWAGLRRRRIAGPRLRRRTTQLSRPSLALDPPAP